MSAKCPECGKTSTGNFCQHCGAKLGGRFCNQCGSEVSGGAKFCNQCGESVPGGGRGPAVEAGVRREAAASVVGGQNLPWWIAGAAMFALIVFAGVRMVTPGPVAPPAAPFANGSGTPPDLSSMTPREAADRLFDRVMTAVSASDSVQAQTFVPMALGAYERAQPLDHDGLFHLSLLNRVAGNLDDALANAVEVLDVDPNHVLALAAAAEATVEMGRTEDATTYYSHLLDVIDSEIERGLPEYVAHSRILESVRVDALAFLAGR